MFSVTIPRLPSPALNPNNQQGKSWHAYAAAKVEDGEAVLLMAHTQRLAPGMPWGAVTVRVHFVIPYVKSPGRRDWDNLIASCKGFWDGLVKGGVLTDDSMDVVRSVQFTMERRQGREGSTTFEIEKLGVL
jgi:Holliday junction resolvase RusA-like endonuclease